MLHRLDLRDEVDVARRDHADERDVDPVQVVDRVAPGRRSAEPAPGRTRSAAATSLVAPPIVGRPYRQAVSEAHGRGETSRDADELLDLRDDVVDLEVGRVDQLRVRRRLHPSLVRLVAAAEVGGERVGADVGTLRLPPARADRRVGLEVDLHLGRRARRRCRCRGPRSRCSRAPASSRCRSRITSRTAAWRATTDTIRSMRDCRIAGGDVDAGDEHAALVVERDRASPRELADRLRVAERQPLAQREPRERAVHRARVEVAEAEPLRELGGRRCSCRLPPVRRWPRSSLHELVD